MLVTFVILTIFSTLTKAKENLERPTKAPFIKENNTHIYDHLTGDLEVSKNLIDFGNTPPASKLPLGICEGDCDSDKDCGAGSYCFMRSEYEVVPGCSGRGKYHYDYCSIPLLTDFGNTPPASKLPLGLCEGDCDSDKDCGAGLMCFMRSEHEVVPGCPGRGKYDYDYCFDPRLTDVGVTPRASELPLGLCEGDCDSDEDCGAGLMCFQRNNYEAVPGCSGRGKNDYDYCSNPRLISSRSPSTMPSLLPSKLSSISPSTMPSLLPSKLSSISPSEETKFTSHDKLITQVKIYCHNPVDYSSQYGPIEDWDVSQVTDMKSIFDATEHKCEIPDISKWDVSQVTNFKNMFYEAALFNVDIGNWDVSRVTSFYAMFRGATDFNQDISKWKVSKATNFGQMFHTAASFNQNISNWHVSEAILFNSMFYRASSFNQNIGKWDVSKVTDFYMMFYSACSFKQNLHAWLEQVNKYPRSRLWCGGCAVCDANNNCDGKTKSLCKTLKDSCVFGKSKIFGACKPKDSSYTHNCANYDDEESCTDDENHGGLCKFKNGGCSHVCDDLNKNYCKKLKDKKDSKNICKPTKVNNPCSGCQLKTTCG